MKKLILALLLAVGVSTAASANMIVVGGNKAIFNEQITFNVVVNDSNALIDGKNQYAKDYYTAKSPQEYDAFVQGLNRAHESFITYYNEKRGSLKSQIVKDAACAYTLKINVTSINVGNGGGVAFAIYRKCGGAVVNGTMALVDNASGEIVCQLVFNDIKGLLCPKFVGRAISVYRYLADALIQTVQ